MPSLAYIEKLTGIKEDWIQNLKETESALVLAVQLPPQEHICPHCKATTRPSSQTRGVAPSDFRPFFLAEDSHCCVNTFLSKVECHWASHSSLSQVRGRSSSQTGY